MVAEPRWVGSRSNWEWWICDLDRKVGRIFGKSKQRNWQWTKNLVLSQWEFRHPRRGKSVHEMWFCGEKSNAVFIKDEELSSNTASLLIRLQSSTTLLSEHKLHVYCNKKYKIFKLPFVISSSLWICIFTLIQKIEFSSPKAIANIGYVIKCLQSIQLEMLAITRRHLCPQPQTSIICEIPRVFSKVGQCQICYIDSSVKSH
jgi:hypothetical protein